ncbi:MAG: hypothetical protein CfP315_0853 [Candidatus Improbicoccus pseudotrichonymphae]|uniref:Uncharacterized protein n=1 Tax=Candidatus Improbicoccus pseudotrichonymphae TaxID=3033792 RepID=A0AA48I528_9FIRM|nr:MAG: hypothetical protein CfP315_0853 [Candidatus Improbicoccus pseudotrichonymphae]
MKNKFIKSLMRKEKISNNENNKKISKNNKIISSILAVVMCCQPLVGAVKSDEFVGNSDGIVEETKGKEDVYGNTGEDSEKKGESIIDKIKNLPDFFKYVLGIILGGGGVYVLCNLNKYDLGLKYLKFELENKKVVYVPTFNMGKKIGKAKENEFTNTDFLYSRKFSSFGYSIEINNQINELIESERSVEFSKGDEDESKKNILMLDNFNVGFLESNLGITNIRSKLVKEKTKGLDAYSREVCEKLFVGTNEISNSDLDGILKLLNECRAGVRFASLFISGTTNDDESEGKNYKLPLTEEFVKLLLDKGKGVIEEGVEIAPPPLTLELE